MAGERYTEEQARAAVADAVIAVRELREATARIVPDRSRGRAKILAACDEALAAVGDAVRGDAVGDDRVSLWRRAMDAGRRAVERAGAFVREVARTAKEKLARLWNITAEAAEVVKRTIAEQLAAAWEKTKAAVAFAGVVLAGLLAASATVAFSGWIVLAAVAVIYFGMKGN